MCFPNTFANHFSLFEGEGGGGIQESGRILFCSPIVKTKKVKFGQHFVLFSGVISGVKKNKKRPESCSVFRGEDLHRDIGTKLYGYTSKLVLRYTCTPMHALVHRYIVMIIHRYKGGLDLYSSTSGHRYKVIRVYASLACYRCCFCVLLFTSSSKYSGPSTSQVQAGFA